MNRMREDRYIAEIRKPIKMTHQTYSELMENVQKVIYIENIPLAKWDFISSNQVHDQLILWRVSKY